MVEKTCSICHESSYSFKGLEKWVCLNSECSSKSEKESEKEVKAG